MSWVYVPESAVWSLDCTSPSRALIQSFLSSKTSFASPFCEDAGQARQSGTMSSPSMGDLGAASSMSSPEASPVSPGVSPASASASKTNAGSSRKLRNLFAKWDQSGSSWRTFQLSLLEEGLPLFSGHWPTSGLMLSGECSAANNWEPVTSASEFSSWATPVAGNCKGEASNNRDLCRDAKGWPTPCASSSGGNQSASPGAVYRPSLNSINRLWNTPTACEDEGTGYRTRGDAKLKGQTKQWQTPIATDATGSPNYTDGTLRLTGQVKQWPTATASDGGGHYGNGSPKLDGATRDWSTVEPGLQDQEQTGGESRRRSGRLNSRFVQWLMGFPHGWSFVDEPVSKHWETQCHLLLEPLLGEFSKVA